MAWWIREPVLVIDFASISNYFIIIYIFQQVAKEKIVEYKDSKTFSVHILERGTKFEEGIEIDEDKELEYFHVPAHNGLTDADFLYDFKNVSFCLFMGKGR